MSWVPLIIFAAVIFVAAYVAHWLDRGEEGDRRRRRAERTKQ